MLPKLWHSVIIAYRLEDDYGNCPYYQIGPQIQYPIFDTYYRAFLDPTQFRDEKYSSHYRKFHVFEYVLDKNAYALDNGVVMFRSKDVISKTIIRR